MEGKKENKVVRGWSLSAENIKWLNECAFSLSTPTKRVSASEVLDNIVTSKRQIADEVRKKAGK